MTSALTDHRQPFRCYYLHVKKFALVEESMDAAYIEEATFRLHDARYRDCQQSSLSQRVVHSCSVET